jgi:GMP synthase (glutamine-hydrolysing)
MVLILDCGSTKVPYIEQAIDEVCDFKTIKLLSFQLNDLEGVKGVVISGAPLLITEQAIQPYLEKISWIKTTTIPVLGICFGHQLMGITFGAFGSKMREDRDWQTVEVVEECLLFDKLSSTVEMMEDHCETISIPAGFRLVASSDVCINEAMQHTSLPLFGVQFHPEVSGNVGRVLFENFVKFSLEYPAS